MAKKTAKEKKNNEEASVEHKGSLAAEMAMKSLQKKFGNVLGWMDKKQEEERVIIPTGSLRLDNALGVGGILLGRLYEIFGNSMGGKSTLCLSIAREAIKLGHKVIYVDAEHALDAGEKGLLVKMGIDTTKVALVQGYTAEDNLDMASTLIGTGEFSMCIIDSISSLQPMAEANLESFGDNTMMNHPRLMSKMCKTFTPLCKRTNTAFLMINQIRISPTSYGCFHGDTKVTFSDGSLHSIKKVVKERLEGPVLSLNEKGEITSNKITSWHNNGKVEDAGWITVTTETVGGMGGTMSFTCTKNHKVFLETEEGVEEVEAGTVKSGDRMISWYTKSIPEEGKVRSILYGSLLGDGKLHTRTTATSCLSLANSEQPEYLKWKLDALEEMRFSKITTDTENNKRVSYCSEFSHELKLLKDKFYSDRGRIIPDGISLNPVMAAVWFMDDGHFKISHRNGSISFTRLARYKDNTYMDRAKKMVVDFIGCTEEEVMVNYDIGIMRIHTSAFETFSDKISKYVIPSMQYKLLEEHRGKYKEEYMPDQEICPKVEKCVSVVKSSETSSQRKYRAKDKYDIAVEGDNSYFVGGGNRGVLVHNSGEVTPGGKAIGFHSSVRIKVIGGGTKSRLIMDRKGEAVGQLVTFDVVKNKLAPPFKKADTELTFGDGFSKDGELFDLAVEMGFIDKAGSWFSYGEHKLGQGKEKSLHTLKSDEAMFNKVEKEVMSLLIGTTDS